MKLTKKQKQEMLADGRDMNRRKDFRIGRRPRGPQTFEAYLRALDDLQKLCPPPARRPFVEYKNVKL